MKIGNFSFESFRKPKDLATNAAKAAAILAAFGGFAQQGLAQNNGDKDKGISLPKEAVKIIREEEAPMYTDEEGHPMVIVRMETIADEDGEHQVGITRRATPEEIALHAKQFEELKRARATNIILNQQYIKKDKEVMSAPKYSYPASAVTRPGGNNSNSSPKGTSSTGNLRKNQGR